MLRIKIEGWAIILLTSLLLAACGSNGKKLENAMPNVKPTEVRHLSADGDVYKIETTVESDAWADARLAEENTKCWSKVTENDRIEIPEGADATTLLTIGLIESNRSLAKAVANNNSDHKPCQLATNSNDVEIAEQEGKTRRTEIRWENAPKVVTTLAATAFGINSQNKNAEIAVAGVNAVSSVAGQAINRAGNNTTVTGDGNQVNASVQTAENESTVADSGNTGSPLSTPEEEVEVTDAASCVAAGFEVRPATEEEQADPTALLFVDAGVVSVCSTGGDIVRVTE